MKGMYVAEIDGRAAVAEWFNGFRVEKLRGS